MVDSTLRNPIATNTDGAWYFIPCETVERFQRFKPWQNLMSMRCFTSGKEAGYYSRARRLHALSRQVVEDYDGVLPSEYEELLELPGIGPYMAAAVASIAFSRPVACVDGNIRRVMARQTNQEDPSPQQIQSYADEQLLESAPGDWNQAMMELGALVCKPRRPACKECPVVDTCLGRSRADVLPLAKTTKRKNPIQLCGPN